MKIGSWEDVDKALWEIGHVDREVARAKVDADQAIASAKAHLATALKHLNARSENLVGSMEAFVREHEAEMDGRSRALIHGKVWLRNVATLTARSWRKALDWLLANKQMRYVRVEHEVNKMALRDAPPEVLKACGARVKHEDTFGYELSEVETR